MASVAGDVVWTGGGECRWTCGVMEFVEFLFIYFGYPIYEMNKIRN